MRWCLKSLRRPRALGGEKAGSKLAGAGRFLLLGDRHAAARDRPVHVVGRLKGGDIKGRIIWVEHGGVPGHVLLHLGLLFPLDTVHKAVSAQLVAIVGLDIFESEIFNRFDFLAPQALHLCLGQFLEQLKLDPISLVNRAGGRHHNGLMVLLMVVVLRRLGLMV